MRAASQNSCWMMTTRAAQKLARTSVFRQQRISSSVALDGVGNSLDNKNRGCWSEVTTDEFARRLNQFKKLTRDFEESAWSGFFALLSRPPTHGVATAGHAGRSHARSNR